MQSVAFDLSDFHGDPGCNRVFVPGFGGIGVKVGCTTCGCLVDVEATGKRVTVADSYALRKAVVA